MYYPFLRGRQNELLALRESVQIINQAGFNPIIEPVQEKFDDLDRTLKHFTDTHATIILNPRNGKLKNNHEKVVDHFNKKYADCETIAPALLLTASLTLDEVLKQVDQYAKQKLTFIHAGFLHNEELVKQLSEPVCDHVFLDSPNTHYVKAFERQNRVLICDGFNRQIRNADYAPLSQFSDLHTMFQDQGWDGYGDFATIGDYFREGGTTPHVVAIHVTYIDPKQNNAMFAHHFTSDIDNKSDEPKDKFLAALGILYEEVNKSGSLILKTSGIEKFCELYRDQHYPGLGVVKKLSIKHHLETLAYYHKEELTPKG